MPVGPERRSRQDVCSLGHDDGWRIDPSHRGAGIDGEGVKAKQHGGYDRIRVLGRAAKGDAVAQTDEDYRSKLDIADRRSMHRRARMISLPSDVGVMRGAQYVR